MQKEIDHQRCQIKNMCHEVSILRKDQSRIVHSPMMENSKLSINTPSYFLQNMLHPWKTSLTPLFCSRFNETLGYSEDNQQQSKFNNLNCQKDSQYMIPQHRPQKRKMKIPIEKMTKSDVRNWFSSIGAKECGYGAYKSDTNGNLLKLGGQRIWDSYNDRLPDEFLSAFEKLKHEGYTVEEEYKQDSINVRVTAANGIAIRKEPEYPGTRLINDEGPNCGDILECTKKEIFFWNNQHIQFYQLANGQGWIHNYIRNKKKCIGLEEIGDENSQQIITIDGVTINQKPMNKTVQTGRNISAYVKSSITGIINALVTDYKINLPPNLEYLTI